MKSIETNPRGPRFSGPLFSRFTLRTACALAAAALMTAAFAQVPTSAKDAPLPKNAQTFWDREPVEVVSRTRGAICLNGLWHFMPAVADSNQIPKSGWGWLAVPGAWAATNYYGLPGVSATGGGTAWENLAGKKQGGAEWNNVNRAWYERTISVPKAWDGRAILLDFDRVSTDAQVFVNNVDCGRIGWPRGGVDISKAVTPGQTATIRVLVVAALAANRETVFMGTTDAQVFTQKANLQTRGIIGDVFLRSQPKGAVVSDVFVIPSVQKKTLGLQITLANVAQTGPVSLMVKCVNPQTGQTEKTFVSSAQAQANPTGEQTINVSFPWASPRLWDLEKPSVYTLLVSADGAGMSDEYAQVFGFREFRIVGKRFLLNEKEVRLRPGVLGNGGDDAVNTVETIDAAITGMRSNGFNIQEFWPANPLARGTARFLGLWYDRADWKGWPVIGSLPAMAGLSDTWDKPGVRETWEKDMASELRRTRNHPSVVMWIHSPNRFGSWNDQAPQVVGNTAALRAVPDGSQKRLPVALDANRLIQKHDPTRPVTTHQGGAAGDLQTVNFYVNFQPLQEQEEWISDWVLHGDEPFLPVEFGSLAGCDFRRGRNTGGWGIDRKGAMDTENWQTEFLASYYGAKAYRDEPAEVRAWHAKNLISGQDYKDANIIKTPLVRQQVAEQGEREARAWRTLGQTAGMIYWEWDEDWNRDYTNVPLPPFAPGRRGVYTPTVQKYRLNYLQPAGYKSLGPGAVVLPRNMQPTLAWIAGGAGAAGDVAAFTAKDHNFAQGQIVKKQIAVLNDTRDPQPYSCVWQATLGNDKVGGGTLSGRIEPAKTLLLPIQFAAQSAACTKTEAKITLTATIGGAKYTDTFSFRVFPPNPPPLLNGTKPAATPVTVFDPVGKTSQMLRDLNFAPIAWSGSTVKNGLLIVGREALSSGKQTPGDLKAFTQSGGRLLVMAQSPEYLRKLGFRVGEFVLRNVFPTDALHPVVAGLDADDLRDWAGSGTLVEPYPLRTEKDKSGWGYPAHGWHWGNRGSVSSAMIEKPHTAGWRPLLEGDFDLAYSPLMEMDYGKGRVTLCTLDLEDHAGVDAGARKTAQNLLDYVQTAPLAPQAQTVSYIGGDAGLALLKRVGAANITPFVFLYDANRAPAMGHTIVVGTGGSTLDEAALMRFVQDGGRVLVLPQTTETGLLGSRLTIRENFDGSLLVPNWDVCRGLSPSDLRARAPHTAWVLTGGEGLQIASDGLFARRKEGKGEIIWTQCDPDRFDADKQTYQRFSRWRQTHAMALLLANMGAPLAANDAFFTSGPVTERLSLDGNWQVKQTERIPSTPATLVDKGVSDAARNAIAAPDDTGVGWETHAQPGAWEAWKGTWADADGEAVFRKTLDVPASWDGQDLIVTLGTIDDFDTTFWNGEPIGKVDELEKPYAASRRYVVPARLVHKGKNVLAVRIFDRLGDGGMTAARGTMSVQTVRFAQNPGGLYHPDYIRDFSLGDDPHRYYRW